MPVISRNFWFLFAAFMLVVIVIWRRRLTTLVGQGAITKAELQRVARLAAVWLVVVPCILGIIAVAAGWSSPACSGTLAFDDPARAMTSAIELLTWVALLWWVWRSNGADLLARIGPALWRGNLQGATYAPQKIRLVITLLVFVSAIGPYVTGRATPAELGQACSATTVAG